MEELSTFQQLTQYVMANRLMTALIFGGLTTFILIALNWDKVRYMAMRFWHGVPLIGSVSRLARKARIDNAAVDKDGWLSSEKALCEHYYTYYADVDKDPEYFRKCEDYLAKVDESGRRTSPFWVVPLSAFLLILEAVGFAYVIGPFINREISANDLQLLTWSVASFLALISGFLAHIAGHQIHHNSLVKKARHWWTGDDTETRDHQIGQVKPLTIDRTYEDDKGTLYNQILARIATNTDVTPRYNWIGVFVAVIIFIAVAAFWIRTEQLNALETTLVADLKADTSVQAFASPFDLPAESAAVNDEASDMAISERIEAEHRASLVTFVVLSVIYVAIQMIALWLGIVYGFAGRHSKRAYELTSKFDNADDMVRWMEQEKSRISSHADHKLRMLQHKVAGYSMASSTAQASQRTAKNRDFVSFVHIKEEQKLDSLQRQRERNLRVSEIESTPAEASPKPAQVEVGMPVVATTADPVALAAATAAPTEPVASVATPAAPEVPVAPVQTAATEATLPKASEFDDLRALAEEELSLLAEEFELTVEQLLKIKSTQLALAKAGRYPKQEVPA